MAFRDKWIEKRESEQSSANGNRNMSQMHWASRGVITEEMRFVAGREKIDPEADSRRNRPRPPDYSRQCEPSQPGTDGHWHRH